MQKTTYTFSCDLCDRNQITEANDLPTGWVNLSIESKFIDRCWTEKHICKECVSQIAKQSKGKVTT